ncbi:WD repeat protein Vps8 [Schizosaccharomyces pombe]|uniref:Vacuolar protein sorting-associated protein 8 n=1 Tax=Schizosaccharomyces pombe (strain 972 / ATCC 24843) TaxID=284812 RepID=VPS8_SCHPO|nr:putative WD repeat-containing protein Vps8 [Schizosaccharomyces pombe]O13756.1 RecName: Full=Vacuolar protein sorting-associated protein 8; AltName: Full=Vacuolar protein-targeting protein 8 [Schizosaccharomyces pombe 972h-]CAB16561.1 WD repeat protein Vps8 (predicted) [Schizosaccharomyces pombe]|eukprot:NP_594240.1 putative WD repeat-containing protein Vps8 [Schizosaccharomyces pombe]
MQSKYGRSSLKIKNGDDTRTLRALSFSKDSVNSSSFDNEAASTTLGISTAIHASNRPFRQDEYSWNDCWMRWGQLRRVSSQLRELRFTMNDQPATVTSIAYQGTLLVAGTSSGHVLLNDWRTNDFQILKPGLSSNESVTLPVTSLAISNSKRIVCQGHAGGIIFVWDVSRKPPLQLFTINQHSEDSVLTHLVFNGNSDDVLLSTDHLGKIAVHEFYNLVINKHCTSWNLDMSKSNSLNLDSIIVDTSSISFEELHITGVKHFSFVVLQSLQSIQIVTLFPKTTLIYEFKYPAGIVSSACHSFSSSIVHKNGENTKLHAFFATAYNNNLRLYSVTFHKGYMSLQLMDRKKFAKAIWKLWWFPSSSIIIILFDDMELAFVNSMSLDIIGTSTILDKSLLRWDWYSNSLAAIGVSQTVFPFISSSLCISPRYMFVVNSETVSVGSFLMVSEQLQMLSERYGFFDSIKFGSYCVSNLSIFPKLLLEKTSVINLIMALYVKLLKSLARDFPARSPFEATSQKTNDYELEVQHLFTWTCELYSENFNTVISSFIIANSLGILPEIIEQIIPVFTRVGKVYVVLEALFDLILSQRFTNPSPQLQHHILNYLNDCKRLQDMDKLIPCIEYQSLDLDFITKFSRSKGLFDSLCYVSIYAFNDYSIPLVQFLNLLKSDIDSPSEETSINVEKGFHFLLYSLTGMKYPLGHSNNINDAYVVIHTLLKVIFSVVPLPFDVPVDNSVDFPYLRLFLEKHADDFFRCLEVAFDYPYFSLEKVTIAKKLLDTVNRQWILECISQLYEKKKSVSQSYYIFVSHVTANYSNQLLFSQSFYQGILDGLCNIDVPDDKREVVEAAIEELLTVYEHFDIATTLLSCWDHQLYQVILHISFKCGRYEDYIEAILALWKQKGQKHSFVSESSEALISLVFNNLQTINRFPGHRERYVSTLISHCGDLFAINHVCFVRNSLKYLLDDFTKVITKTFSIKSIRLQFLSLIIYEITYEQLSSWYRERTILSFLELVSFDQGDVKMLELLRLHPKLVRLQGLMEILNKNDCIESCIFVYRELAEYKLALSHVSKYIEKSMSVFDLEKSDDMTSRRIERLCLHLKTVVPLFEQCTKEVSAEDVTNFWLELVFTLLLVYIKLSLKGSINSQITFKDFQQELSLCIENLLDSFLSKTNSYKIALNTVLVRICEEASRNEHSDQYLRKLLLKLITDLYINHDITKECFLLWDMKQFYEIRSTLLQNASGVLVEDPKLQKNAKGQYTSKLKVYFSGLIEREDL